MLKSTTYFARSWLPLALVAVLSACGSDTAGDDAAAAGQAAGGTAPAGTGGSAARAGNGGAGGSTRGGNAGNGANVAPGGAGPATGGVGPATGGVGPATGGASGSVAMGGGGAQSVGGTGASGTSAGGSAGTSGTGAGGHATGGAGGAAAGSGGAGGSGGQQVGLPAGVTALFPGPNAANICKDPQLRITFPAPPTLGSSGTIQVVTAGGSVAASVNLASGVTDTIGGQSFMLERRAYVDGNTAVIYLPSKGLAYGETYSVTIPAGAIVPSGGGSFSLSGTSAWRFSTAAAAPSDLSSIAVALDGTGAFCSLQGALDALPANNTKAATITLADGNYHEVVYFKNKSNVTLHGQSRSGTVILGTNNNNLNPSTKGRALVGADGAQGLVIENLTIKNLTPQGGSQAEALRLESCTHCTIRDADILSLQDTLLWSGTLYAKNCYVAGNVDFIWGTGAAYFDQCEIKTVGRSGYVVQSRNGTSGYGYVFVDSKITADSGVTGSVLARIDVSVYPGSHVAYVNCAIGSHISAAGWVITGGSPGSSLRFWEYQSTDLNGNALDVSKRLAGSTQISASQAATMRDPSAVLGGWQPPN